MPSDIAKTHGMPNWVECACADLDVAETFYAKVFGWSSERLIDNNGNLYAMQFLQGKRVAGMFALTPELQAMGVPPHWATYFEVADVDAALKKVKAAGGTVMDGPGEVPDVGKYAIICDTVGSYPHLWQSVPQQGAEVIHVPGAVMWNELSTHDPDKAAAFYKSVLGVDTKTVMAGQASYTELYADGQLVAGILQLPPEMAPAPSTWDVYFATDDVAATVAKADEAGGKTLAGPIDLPDGGQLGVIQDPQGAVFKVLKMGDRP